MIIAIGFRTKSSAATAFRVWAVFIILIYENRGQKVMLDFDLAHIYGYETRYFNRQVKNNIERFDDDFMFQLTVDEVNQLLRCKNFTSWDNGFFLGKKAGQESLLLPLPSMGAQK